MSQYISGVILYDETIWQKRRGWHAAGQESSNDRGAIPGIKVDEGHAAFAELPG